MILRSVWSGKVCFSVAFVVASLPAAARWAFLDRLGLLA